MSYYLKKTKLKGRTYLSIDESFYSSKTKGTAHRVFQSLGSVETLKEKGMADPVSFYQKEVDIHCLLSSFSKAFRRITSSSKVLIEGSLIISFIEMKSVRSSLILCLFGIKTSFPGFAFSKSSQE